MIVRDALYLVGQCSFLVSDVVRWNSTPRRAVFAALDRLRILAFRQNGVLLSRAPKIELRRLTGVRKGWKDWKSFGRRIKSAAIVEAVTNDLKSLLIRVSYTSTSPEQSAQIANAFAQAYIRSRAEKSAQQTLADLAATYGPKHPRVLKAQAQLEKAQAQLEDEKAQAQLETIVSDSAQILAWASPPVSPSGPNRRLIVAVSFICGFAAGTILVLILERANTSFRSDAELAFKAKAPCLGIFAEDRSRFRKCPCNSHGR